MKIHSLSIDLIKIKYKGDDPHDLLIEILYVFGSLVYNCTDGKVIIFIVQYLIYNIL